MLKSFADGRLFGGAWGPDKAGVLALHGWRRDHHDFDAVFAGSGTGPVGAVAPDLAGFGAAPPPPEPWGSEQYARQLLPLFAGSGPLGDRVVLVGHSFGGRVAVRLWGLVPDRIERLVLSGVPLLDRQGRRSRPAPLFRVVRRLHRMGMVGETRMEAARQRFGSPDYRAATGVMRDVFVTVLAERYADELAEVSCPVQLVWGEDDTEVPLEVALRAAPLFPSATLVTLPGVGHLVPTEAPGVLGDLIAGRPAPEADSPAGAMPADTGRGIS